jgi:hypothetical protein
VAGARLIAACAAPTAAAHRAWLPPEELAPSGECSSGARLAMPGRGDVIASWGIRHDIDPTFASELYAAVKPAGR